MTSTLLVSKRQERQARELVEHSPVDNLVTSGDSGAIDIPSDLVMLLRTVIEAVGRGGSVTIQTLPQELSTTLAAEQLGVSRPTLMKMINSGEIPAHKVGSHHRIKLEDLRAFRLARLERQRKAFEELRELEDHLIE